MTIPRLAGFVGLLVLNRLLWKRFAFDIDLRRCGRAALYGVPLIGLALGALTDNCGRYWPRSAVIVAIFTTPVVGLFEEYAWRGVILEALLATRSRLSAIALSSLLFTVYHVEAQPLFAWPAIFLTGVVLGNYRIRGLSLFWLAGIHTAIDVAYFFFATDYFPTSILLPSHVVTISESPACTSHDAVFLGGLALLAVVTYPRATATTRP